MSDSVQPHRWQPTRLPHPWDSPGKNTGVGCHFLLQCMKWKVKVNMNKSQFENVLQTSTDLWIAFLEYFGEISFHYPSRKLWNFFKNTEFIISRIISSQPITQAEVFYIDGTKNAKASFWSLKEYNVFYTKFHSAQQNELYALIQVICLRPYLINVVSDSIYSGFVLNRVLLVPLVKVNEGYLNRDLLSKY